MPFRSSSSPTASQRRVRRGGLLAAGHRDRGGGQLRDEEAGADRVDRDVVAAPFGCQGSSEPEHRRLGGVVGDGHATWAGCRLVSRSRTALMIRPPWASQCQLRRLFGGDPGEIPEILLGFFDDLRIVVVLDFCCDRRRPRWVRSVANLVDEVGDPLFAVRFQPVSAVIDVHFSCRRDHPVTTAASDGTCRMVDSAVSAWPCRPRS